MTSSIEQEKRIVKWKNTAQVIGKTKQSQKKVKKLKQKKTNKKNMKIQKSTNDASLKGDDS